MPVQDVFIPPDAVSNNGKNDPKSKIQKLLQDRESLAAQRAEVAEIERITAEAEREKRRLEADIDAIGSYRHNGNSAHHSDDEEKQKLSLQAVTLLNSGVDPRIVGQILAGSNPITTMSAPQPVNNNGEWMTRTVKDLVTIITGVKRDSEIEHMKDKLAKLEQDLKDERMGKKRQSENGNNGVVVVNPLKQASEAAASVGMLYQTFRDIGLVREPVSIPGTNLEVVRETHRHAERIREIDLEDARKGEKADMFTSGIEKVGKVVADAIRTRTPVASHETQKTQETQVQMFKCACGADLAAIPEASEITCPRCSNVYARSGNRSNVDEDPILDKSSDINHSEPGADVSSGI